MRIKNSNHFSPMAFTLTNSVLKEVTNIINHPYRLEVKDIDPKQTEPQEVPYEMLGYTSYEHADGKFRATVKITRGLRGAVTQLEIGCQTFKGKAAQAILKAATLARKKKPAKKTTK